jgi:hypothetical protein
MVTLVCQQDMEGYEVQLGQSYWYSIPLVGERTVQWQRDNYAPLTDIAHHEQRLITWALDDRMITVEVTYAGAATQTWQEPLPSMMPDMLITSMGSWPWQLSALSFETGALARLVHLTPDTWRPATQDNGPVVQTMLVRIIGLEVLDTPAGARDAWRVEVGEREMAWYDAATPHTLLRYFNGMETWEAVEQP